MGRPAGYSGVNGRADGDLRGPKGKSCEVVERAVLEGIQYSQLLKKV